MQRSTVNLSHDHPMSLDMGYLAPVCALEVLPGDSFIGQTQLMARVAPLVNPVMHKVDIRVHHWYVPNRIIDPDFEDGITGKDETYTVPKVTIATEADHSLVDHFGIPYQAGLEINAHPVRAVNAIWNEFYRDQDLQVERDQDDLTLPRIAWGKDYFTTCRPQPQQGDSISIPFSTGQVPVSGLAFTSEGKGPPSTYTGYESGTGTGESRQISGTNVAAGVGGDMIVEHDSVTNHPAIFADLTATEGGIDVNDLRRSIALQRFAEARMRFGSRYADYLKFLGVNPSDGRLDRPEYLGGGSQMISFTEVLATAEGANTQVGDLYGHGIAAARTRRFRKMFEEHGWMISLISARPKTVYMESVNRSFLRNDAMDFWQKELEVLPWQEVRQNEVHVAGDPSVVFGYAPRYDDYRFAPSYVSGSFRDGPEKDWHMAREFGTPPTLNSSFVECTPTDRIYGDVEMPELLINAHNSITARRLVRMNAGMGF